MKERLLTTLFVGMSGLLCAQGAFVWGEEVGGNYTTFKKLEVRNNQLYCYGQFFDVQTIGGFTLNSANGPQFRARLNPNTGFIEEVAQNPVYGFPVSTNEVLMLERISATAYRLKRMSHTGLLIWNYTVDGTGSGDITFEDVATDDYGNIYVQVSFNVGSLQLNGQFVSPTEMKGLYVWKLAADGESLWGKKIGGAGTKAGGIETFDDGDVLVASQNNTNITLQRLKPDNSVAWSRQLTTEQTAPENLKCIAGASGHVYLGGTFRYGLSSNDNVPVSLNSAGQRDGFLIKYDGEGELLWARAFGGTQDDMLNDYSTDGAENVYCVGTFGNQISFGNGMVIDDGFPAATTFASYVALYRHDGTALSADRPMATTAGGNQSQFVRVLTTDDACYIAGKAYGPTSFGGALMLGLNLAGFYYPFVVKYQNAQLVDTEEPTTTIEPAQPLRAWPNPSYDGHFQLDVPENVDLSELVFEVYSTNGRLVRRQEGDAQFELADAAPGLYLVRTIHGDNVAVTRVVIGG